MLDTERSDAELLASAEGGSAPAFARLLHRHAAAVRARAAHAKDPDAVVLRTFVTAMRRLPDRPEDDARAWLLDLADGHLRGRAAGVDAEPPDLHHDLHPGRSSELSTELPPSLPPERLDAIWLELADRWPDGRRRRALPAWLGWAALVVALACLAVIVPYALITVGDEADDGEQALPPLVARPFDGERAPAEPEPPLPEPLDPPDFEFPEVDLGTPAVTPPPAGTDPASEPEPSTPSASAPPSIAPTPDPVPPPAADAAGSGGGTAERPPDAVATRPDGTSADDPDTTSADTPDDTAGGTPDDTSARTPDDTSAGTPDPTTSADPVETGTVPSPTPGAAPVDDSGGEREGGA